MPSRMKSKNCSMENERYIIGADFGSGPDIEKVAVYDIVDNHIIYSWDACDFRRNFEYTIKKFGVTYRELAVDIAKLFVLSEEMHEAYMKCECGNGKPIGSYRHFYGRTIDFYIERELTDEEKFTCSLLNLAPSEYGLTSNELMRVFGWTRYRCRKIRSLQRYAETLPLFREDRCGYFGKGWLLDYKIGRFIERLRDAKLEALKQAENKAISRDISASDE